MGAPGDLPPNSSDEEEDDDDSDSDDSDVQPLGAGKSGAAAEAPRRKKKDEDDVDPAQVLSLPHLAHLSAVPDTHDMQARWRSSGVTWSVVVMLYRARMCRGCCDVGIA